MSWGSSCDVRNDGGRGLGKIGRSWYTPGISRRYQPPYFFHSSEICHRLAALHAAGICSGAKHQSPRRAPSLIRNRRFGTEPYGCSRRMLSDEWCAIGGLVTVEAFRNTIVGYESGMIQMAKDTLISMRILEFRANAILESCTGITGRSAHYPSPKLRERGRCKISIVYNLIHFPHDAEASTSAQGYPPKRLRFGCAAYTPSAVPA